MSVINKLTLGEVAKIEELTGLSISSLEDGKAPQGKMMAALAFVAKRREDPKFSWNDAMALTIDEATAIIGLDETEGDEADPLAPGTPQPKAKSKADPKRAKK